MGVFIGETPENAEFAIAGAILDARENKMAPAIASSVFSRVFPR